MCFCVRDVAHQGPQIVGRGESVRECVCFCVCEWVFVCEMKRTKDHKLVEEVRVCVSVCECVFVSEMMRTKDLKLVEEVRVGVSVFVCVCFCV